MSISNIVFYFFNVVLLLMFIRCVLSWFPVNWYKEPFFSLKKFTDIIFDPFRKVIPPIGMLDFSAILAFLAVSLVQYILTGFLVGIGF